MGDLVCVTGGTGVVGPALVRHLVDNGNRVKVLARRNPAGNLPPQAEFLPGDIVDFTTVQRVVADCRYVFHLAAKLHINDPDPGLRAEYERVNVEGTYNVVRAAEEAGVQRLVFFSTIAVYGYHQRPDDPPLTEAAPLQPTTLYGQTKAKAEEIARSGRNACGEPLSIILRLASIYGPHVKGNYAHLAGAIRRGRYFPIGPGTNRRTLIYETDAARAAYCAALAPPGTQSTYNVTDGHVHTMRSITAAIYHACGRRPPRWHLPLTPTRRAIQLVEKVASGLDRPPPFSMLMLEKLLEDVAVAGDRLQQELRYRPQYDLSRGWHDTMAQLP